MSKRKAEQPHPADEQPRPASVRRSARLLTAAFVGTPFRGLATVELQLIMQHCDLKTLLALARCSRFTLHAASHSFAWRALSPLSISSSQIADLRGSQVLVHCDVALRWLPPTNWNRWRQPKVDDAELAAIESVPRLVKLDADARKVKSAELRRLLSHPALAGLTALHIDTSQMDDSFTALLPLHQPRLRTLSLFMCSDPHSDPRFLAPLAQLEALTDLSLDGSNISESAVEIISRCASLRRLHLSNVEPAALFAVLAAPARSRLESLSLSDVMARPQLPIDVPEPDDGTAMSPVDVQSWKASFENLRSLRALCLRDFDGFDVVFAGVAAALATGSALRNLTALRADTLEMDAVGRSLISVLAAHCPQLRRLHIHDMPCSHRHSPGALAGLPSLSGLRDLRVHCSTRHPSGDELAVGRCASLTRLHLNAVRHSSLRSILRSPQLQRLESLTLESVHFDSWADRADVPDGPLSLDWSVCFANLRSLRALSLESCHGGDLLLAGAQAACPPLLRTMRFRHSDDQSSVSELKLLPALLAQIPELRVELFEEAPSDGPAYHSDDTSDELRALHVAWHKLKRKHPERVTITKLKERNFDVEPFSSWSD